MRTNLSLVRTQIEQLRSALLSSSPEKIEQSLPSLAEAVTGLGMAQQYMAQQNLAQESLNVKIVDPELGRELKALKNELNAVRRLVDHGAAFYQGWAKLLGSATAGYTPTGGAAPISATGTVSIRG